MAARYTMVRAARIRWRLIALIVAALLVIGSWFAVMTHNVLVTGDDQFTIGQGIGMSHFYFGIENAEGNPESAINHVAALMTHVKPIPGVVGYAVFLSPSMAKQAHLALPAEGLAGPVVKALNSEYTNKTTGKAWIPYFTTDSMENQIPTALLTKTVNKVHTVWLSPWVGSRLLTLAPIIWHGKTVGVSVVDQIPKERAVPYVNHAMTSNLYYQMLVLAAFTLFLYWIIGRWVVKPIKYQAEHDLMTGLYNQMTFWRLFKDESSIMEKRQLPVTMLAFDMDHFKQVNDTFGHKKGDEVLQMLSSVISNHCRKSDIVGRMGGEEFGAILPGCSVETAQAIAEKIRSEMEAHSIQDRKLTVSIGISSSALLLNSFYDYERIAKTADQALYEAKETGRNKVITYHSPAA